MRGGIGGREKIFKEVTENVYKFEKSTSIYKTDDMSNQLEMY